MDKKDLLAGMLLFRLLYYVVPFVISIILLTFREVVISARMKRVGDARPGSGVGPTGKVSCLGEHGDSGA
jgi:hypothetical protein